MSSKIVFKALFGLGALAFLGSCFFLFIISNWKSLHPCFESISLSHFTLAGCVIKAQETGRLATVPSRYSFLSPFFLLIPPHKSWQATQFSSHSRTLRSCLLTWK